MPLHERTTGESDARQVFDRLAGTWTYWGWKGGYFTSEDDARAFFDEHRYMLAMQMGAPNSPQWFNTGLHWAYGIDGPGQGHFYVDHETGQLTASQSAYEHPQPHACFIQSIEDDLVNENGIMDLWVREARLFKYGSGTGTNFSKLRSENEKLSGGGKSSGLMSFLRIGDRAAGAIKSGGTTRRAAKMVVVDIDHPDIESYIDWKVKEEQKVAALVTGSKICQRRLKAIMKACVNCEAEGEACFEAAKNPALKRAIKEARRDLVPDNLIRRVIQFARQGYKDIEFATYDTDWDSEAYLTVSGQNSNNSVRVTDEFLNAVIDDKDWDLTARLGGRTVKTLKARDLWEKVGFAAWASADPGIQFHTTINDWHTCPKSGPIRASNPCSEYMFLDDTACNLASLNLMMFRDADKRFDVDSFEHACRLWTIALEVSVLMAQFPSKKIAELSYRYRTLGLGFANIGGCLMASGIPYDSPEGRAICGALSAIMTGVAYATSAEMAGELGTFPGYEPNAQDMLRVIRNHRRAAYGHKDGYEKLAIAPVPLDAASCPDDRLIVAAKRAWDNAIALGQEHGYRNAQATVVAPTGTIGLVMDCDTTGIEPDFALVKFKKLAGGGYFKIINQAVPEALRTLGYGEAEIAEIEAYAVGHGTLAQAPSINHGTLMAKGFTEDILRKVNGALKTAFDISFVFNKWTIGEEFLTQTLKIPAETLNAPGFDLLAHLGFSKKDIEAANEHVCGAMTLEGAPHLDEAASARVRLRQPVRPQGQALPVGGEPHPHDGGEPAVHLRRHLQDHQHAERRERGGLQGVLHALLAARAEGQRALSRRLQAVAAAQRAAAGRRRRRAGGGGRADGRRQADGGACGRGGRADRGADHRARADARAREAAQPAQELHAEGHRRRPQGVSPHGRVRGRAAGRNLHRHAQGRRRLPLVDEQLRHRHLAGPAVRRAAGRVRGGLHLHALRAGGAGAGQRHHQERHLDPGLHLPRAGGVVPRPQRSGPRRSQRGRQHGARLVGGGAGGAGAAAGGRQVPVARPDPRPGEPRVRPALDQQRGGGRADRARRPGGLAAAGGGDGLPACQGAHGDGHRRADRPAAGAVRSPKLARQLQDQIDTRAKARLSKENLESDRRAEAKMKGYEGENCRECGNFTLRAQRHLPQVRHVRRDERV